jgi:hypothetical protein
MPCVLTQRAATAAELAIIPYCFRVVVPSATTQGICWLCIDTVTPSAASLPCVHTLSLPVPTTWCLVDLRALMRGMSAVQRVQAKQTPA